MSAAPAKLAGLDKSKGHLAVGYDADIVIWHPEKEFKIVPEMIHFKNKLTPYLGMNLYGVVETTFVRGRKIYDRGQFAENASGELLTD
jgi:allantoinase